MNRRIMYQTQARCVEVPAAFLYNILVDIKEKYEPTY